MTQKKHIIPLVAALCLGLCAGLHSQGTGTQSIKVKVTAEQANLRERPDIGSAILQQIPKETIIPADRKEGEWYLVRFTLEDGGVMAGFIHESLVTVVETARPAPAAKGQPTTVAQAVPDRESQTRGRRQLQNTRSRPEPDFRLSVWGAWSRVGAEDLNSGAGGMAAYTGALLGTVPVGSVDALRSALGLGFEFSFQVSSGIHLGIGTEVLKGSDKSVVDYPLEPVAGTYTTKPSVQTIPIKISLSFYPVKNLYVKGAAGYYFARTQYFYRVFAGPVNWQEWSGKTTSQGLGAEGSVGGEWDVSPILRFFVEAGYRYAKIKRFVGTESYSDAAVDSLTTDGTLFSFLKMGPDDRNHVLLFIRETTPDEEGVVDARDAEIDFSGAVLRAGIRIRF